MPPFFASPPEGSAIFRPLSTQSIFSTLAATPPQTTPTTSPSPSPVQTRPNPTSPPANPTHPCPNGHGATHPLPRHIRARYQFDPATTRDLGDDDSFSPDIVSGYQFNLPLAREAPILPAPFVPEQPDNVSPVPTPPQPNFEQDESQKPDPDHRQDAVYDDLDDIGDWVANTAPPNTDLTKKFASAVSRNATLNTTALNKPTIATANAALSVHQRAEDKRRENNARDKLDRATVEQVLDPRTRMILFRLLSRNRLRTLDGCVSTGKEANVYFATAAADPTSLQDADGLAPPCPGLAAHDYSPDAPVAVKVFKTSILQFKDRERYVAGEFRFRRSGYQRGSNRKMVQQWAEKEFRNQMRLQEAGIPAPVPLLLKPPVLIMSFFGQDGWPAPRLKDASLSPSRLAKLYSRVCMLMRRMFRVARLVHGDLSEYNMLYWKGEVIIIDVSQSVEDDHPMALDFLCRDCHNVNSFFRRSGAVSVMTVRELFDFVSGEHISDNEKDQEAALGFLLETAAARDASATKLGMQDDEVFMRSFIPRTLHDVEMRDQQYRSKPSEDIEQNLFAKLTGLSLTQKRERGASRSSKSPSVSEESQAGASGKIHSAVPADLEPHQDPYSFNAGEDSGTGNMPNLEIPLVEPATVRTLPAPEKFRMRSSSPCTSNSSSRPNGEELDARRYSRILEEKSNQDAAFGAGSSFGNAEDEQSEEARLEEKEPFEENEDSDSSSGEVWIRKSREASADPYMGLSKKEWKKRVKAENREKREHKVPKHVKKRKETLAKRRRGNK